MVFSTPVDAVGLAARIRDELPPGSARNYAAMVILNYLVSYSERYGLHIEDENRPAVTSLSLEFLYLAWYHGVDIKLDQNHTKDWSVQTWKDSASLGINLRTIVAMVDQGRGLRHDQLRDARTLLSFGAIVNRYHEALKVQTRGLERFRKSYSSFSVGSSPLSVTSPTMGPTNPGDEVIRSGWGWSGLWGNSKPRTLKQASPSPRPESFPKPVLKPPPPVNLLLPPRVTSASMAKLDSSTSYSTGSISISPTDSMLSTATTTSLQSNQIGAMERLEAYLSVLGTPKCVDIKLMPVKKKRLVPLEEAEKAPREFKLQEPLRRTRKELEDMPTIVPQKEPLISKGKKPLEVRWMTSQELKTRRDKLEEQRVGERLKEMKKMKWKGAKSTQLMPRRAALVNSHFARNGTEGSPEIRVSPESNQQILVIVDEE